MGRAINYLRVDGIVDRLDVYSYFVVCLTDRTESRAEDTIAAALVSVLR